MAPSPSLETEVNVTVWPARGASGEYVKRAAGASLAAASSEFDCVSPEGYCGGAGFGLGGLGGGGGGRSGRGGGAGAGCGGW
jgi:hypothetical protein